MHRNLAQYLHRLDLFINIWEHRKITKLFNCAFCSLNLSFKDCRSEMLNFTFFEIGIWKREVENILSFGMLSISALLGMSKMPFISVMRSLKSKMKYVMSSSFSKSIFQQLT